MGIFNDLNKKANSVQDSYKIYYEYFYTPALLYISGQHYKFIDFCDYNYCQLIDLLDKDNSGTLIIYYYFKLISDYDFKSKIFSKSAAEEKLNEYVRVITRIYKKEYEVKNSFWYLLAYELLKDGLSESEKINLVTNSAKLDNPLGYYRLALMHKNTDRVKYVELLEKVLMLDSNNCLALNDLATAYSDGFGVSKDLAKAMELYEKADENGSRYASFNIALLYSEKRKFVKAFYYFVKYTNETNDIDGIKQAFKICAYLSEENNPYDLIHAYLFTRVLYADYSQDSKRLFKMILSSRPKLFRFIETMANHPDKIHYFIEDGCVKGDIGITLDFYFFGRSLYTVDDIQIYKNKIIDKTLDKVFEINVLERLLNEEMV